MSTLADLHRAVGATLASKRLGRPVFVRYLCHSPDKSDAVLLLLTELVSTVSAWHGQALAQVYAVGGAGTGHVSLTLEFDGGATALVGWARSQLPGGVDLMVLGNRGAIYHDAGAAELWADPPGLNVPGSNARLTAVLERALRSGKPEGVTP